MSHHIQVCCRIRPRDFVRGDTGSSSVKDLFEAENQENPISVIAPEPVNSINDKEKKGTLININGKLNFAVDNVFEDIDQNEVFMQSLEPVLHDLFKGIHCTLFAYGQTGSGKTHTVLGGNENNKGLLPRAMEFIFNNINSSLEQDNTVNNETKGGFKPQTVVKLSIVEIYHEKLNDLLKVSAQKNPLPGMDDSSNLAIRQATDGTIFVENLSETSIQNMNEFNKYLTTALKKRQMGTHKLNEYSSRSHLCCLVDLLQWKYNTSGSPVKLHSKLSIIDLAGSEMVRTFSVSKQIIFLNEVFDFN
jgi:hypothetical protein